MLTHWKRPWCWEGLGAGGEGDDRGWDGWMASLTWWTWVWVNSGSWWWTGRPGVLRFMGLQRVGHDWVTELNWTCTQKIISDQSFLFLCDICIIVSSLEFAFKLRFSWRLYPLIRGFLALVKKTLFGCYHPKSNKWNPFILLLFTHDDSQHILAFWSFLDSGSHQVKMSCHIVWKRNQGFHEWGVNEGRIFHLWTWWILRCMMDFSNPG